jgi:hypothetical protein
MASFLITALIISQFLSRFSEYDSDEAARTPEYGLIQPQNPGNKQDS